MIVLEPGVRFDPATDLFFIIGEVITPDLSSATINGVREIPARALRVGATYRLRFLNTEREKLQFVALRCDTTVQRWTPIATDGADLTSALRNERISRFTIAVGESYDFLWTPQHAMDAGITKP